MCAQAGYGGSHVSNLRAITRAILLIEEFRKVDKELPMQSALILLHVAKKPGISSKELAQLAGLAKSSISRNIAALSAEFGKGYITSYDDPLDRRNRVSKLTPEGERLVRSVLHYIDPDEGLED